MTASVGGGVRPPGGGGGRGADHDDRIRLVHESGRPLELAREAPAREPGGPSDLPAGVAGEGRRPRGYRVKTRLPRVARRRLRVAELAERRARLLADTGRLLVDFPGREPSLAGITRLVTADFADCCAIHLPEGGHLVLMACAHADRRAPLERTCPERQPRSVSQAIATTMRSGEPSHLHSRQSDEPCDVLCSPILAGGQLLGLLTLCRFGGAGFDESDEQTAAELALRVGLALNHARLFRDAETARVRTERMQSVTAALSEATDTREIADAVLHHAGIMEGCHSGMLALLSDDGAWLRRVYPIGYQPDALHRWDRFPVAADTPLGDAALRMKLLAYPTREAVVDTYPAVREAMLESGTEAVVALPLVVRGTLLGAMGLGFPIRRTFTVEDRAFLAAMAHLSAQALARGRLMEREHAARSEAEAAVAARDEVLRVVAHDLGNPLSGVLTTSAALMRAGSDEVAREAAQNIHRAAQQMQRLRRDLLDVAMIDAHQLSMVRAPVAPRELLEDAVVQLRQVAGDRRISLAVSASEGLPAVDADRDRILQVITNLLVNAIKFSADGAEVACWAEAEADSVRFGVRDQGPGVPAEHRAHVFDRFWRSGSRRGAGLGLTISRGIVEAHGGRIWLSDSTTSGAEFLFSLPTSPSV